MRGNVIKGCSARSLCTNCSRSESSGICLPPIWSSRPCSPILLSSSAPPYRHLYILGVIFPALILVGIPLIAFPYNCFAFLPLHSFPWKSRPISFIMVNLLIKYFLFSLFSTAHYKMFCFENVMTADDD